MLTLVATSMPAIRIAVTVELIDGFLFEGYHKYWEGYGTCLRTLTYRTVSKSPSNTFTTARKGKGQLRSGFKGMPNDLSYLLVLIVIFVDDGIGIEYMYIQQVGQDKLVLIFVIFNNLRKMIQFVLIALLALVTYFVYRWFIVPKKMMAHYVAQFRSRGYKVAQLPFNPFSATHFASLYNSVETKKDPGYSLKNDHAEMDVIIGNILNKPDIVLTNVDLIQEANTHENVMKLPKVYGLFDAFYDLMKNGILRVEGQEWKHRRKILSQVFNYDLITSQIPMMIDMADQVFEQFEKTGKIMIEESGKKSQLQVNLLDIVVKYTSSIVISGFLGLRSLNEQIRGQPFSEVIIKLSCMAMDSTKDPLIMIFGEKFVNKRWRKVDRDYLQLKSQVKAILQSYIDQYRAEAKNNKKSQSNAQKNVVELLIAEAEKNKDQKEQYPITDQGMIDDIITFMIAGTETTSNFLVAMIFYIFQKPEIAKKIKEQINSAVKSNQDINPNTFKKMSYLECVILQVSRVFASVPLTFQRQAIEDVTIDGVTIKKSTYVDFAWLNMFYNPKTFENPKEFIPERWEKEENKKHKNLVSMIFSTGPRSCLGKHLSLTEMKVMIIKLMRRYENVVELGLQQGRSFILPFAIQVKNSQAILVKGHS